jgi:tRNA threonylcarbamoyladenosine biosynthesis protein TsaE
VIPKPIVLNLFHGFPGIYKTGEPIMHYFPDILEKNKTLTINVCSLEETHALGREMGGRITPGTVILLHGDLGSGKTTFVQGLARGLGVPDTEYVTSPTYTIINDYIGRCPLYHLDLYRISDTEELWNIGVEEIFDGRNVVAVEWPERLPGGLFKDHVSVAILLGSGDSRIFSITVSDVDLIR